MLTNFILCSAQENSYLKTAISIKTDGSMKIDHGLLKDKEILRNRNNFMKKLGIQNSQFVSAKLNQGNIVKIVSNKDGGKFINNTDGLITNSKGIFLGITVADCLPIFIYDSKSSVIGLLHAGWRGLEKEIIKNAINLARSNLNLDIKNVKIGIGPGISTSHYEVSHDFINKFKFYKNCIVSANEKYYLDLKLIAKQQLLSLQVPFDNIYISPFCTYQNTELFFSFRRDKPQKLQTMLAVIGLE